MKIDKKTEKNYQYWENEFDGHHSYMIPAQDNEYGILRDIILTFIADGESVLDVGCASGGTYDWIKAKKRNLTYKGTDYAKKFVEANKKRHPNILWEVEDCRYLAEEDGEFDIVIIYDVLDALEGWELAINEAYRVATKKVIVLMWMDANMAAKKELMRTHGRVVEMDIEGDGVHYHKILVGWK